MSTQIFHRKKRRGEKLAMVTAYDWSFARLINQTQVDAILVGDSAAMVMHGFKDTPSMPLEAMLFHVASVARGAPDKFIVADIPFGWAHRSLDTFMEAVGRLVDAGAHAIKIEGTGRQNEAMSVAIDAGVPVMGHIGLTPQHVHRLGGYRVQGRNDRSQQALVDQALELEQLGCFGCVLECVMPEATERVQAALRSMATIGIGAGDQTDGQVLVLHDLLGFSGEAGPRFVRRFGEIGTAVVDAVDAYCAAVEDSSFPAASEIYGG